jgi:precorrin-6A synthase
MKIDLCLVGIGTGNPDHVTREGARALNAADLILVPHKGAGKADLAELRLQLCKELVTNPSTQVVGFEMPERDADDPDYPSAVNRWHDAIAGVWLATLSAHWPASGAERRVALLVWGDPSLYDSTLRIADRLAVQLPVKVTVVPGITALQALTAAHCIALNEINAPVTITTGRQLQDYGWPESSETVAVMLDGQCAFKHLAPKGIKIWWGAYLGMPQQICIAGPLAEVSERIQAERLAARAAHGWVMDTYLMRRERTTN